MKTTYCIDKLHFFVAEEVNGVRELFIANDEGLVIKQGVVKSLSSKPDKAAGISKKHRWAIDLNDVYLTDKLNDPNVVYKVPVDWVLDALKLDA